MSDRSRLSVAFIAVGSNIEPRANIVAALTALMKSAQVVCSSTFYRTEALGPETQPPFINGVWQVHSEMGPVQIREDLLRPIESKLGRRSVEDKFAPRTIDLDLVLYNDLVIDEMDLRLPHPDIARPFVCVPVLELLEEDRPGVERDLRKRMMRLLPQDVRQAAPGEVLEDFTHRLQRLAGGCSTPDRRGAGSPGRIGRRYEKS